MRKNILIIVISIFVTLFAITSIITAAEPDEIAKWQDERIKTEYSVLVLNEEKLENVVEKERQEIVLKMSNKLNRDSYVSRYEAQEEEVLNEYIGKELNFEEIIKLTEGFTLIMLTASRQVDTDNITKNNIAQLSEVIEIREEGGSRIYVPDHYEYLYEDENFIKNDELYAIPGSKVAITYILPELESDSIVVEIQSTVASKYVTEKVFIENK